jgi:hypothetical protein
LNESDIREKEVQSVRGNKQDTLLNQLSKLYGNDEAEGGAIPQLSRNCDGNERRTRHWNDRSNDKSGKAGK